MTNKNNCVWDELTNQYSLSKTLRFELIPQEKTLANIQEKGLISEDEQRDKDFLEVKEIIDKYLSYFIERNLSGDKNLVEEHHLKEIQEVYENLKKNPTDEKLKKNLASLQSQLRKDIFKQIKSKGHYKEFFGKDFIKKVLLNYYKDDKNKYDLLEKFERWNTYFTGFYDNRRNIFTDKDISTSLTYRIVNDNLPKFLDNISNFNKIKDKLQTQKIEEEFKEYLNGMSLNVFFSLYNFKNCLNQSGIDKFNLLIGGRSPDGEKKIQGLNEYINEEAQKYKDKTEAKKIRKVKMMPLFKQMLSERQSNSFQFEKINDDKELIGKINHFNQEIEKNLVFKKIRKSFEKLEENELKEIYLNGGKNITNISQQLFGDWDKLSKGLETYADRHFPKKQEREKWLKSKYFSVYELEESIELLKIRTEFDDKLYEQYLQNINNNEEHPICGFLSKFNKKEINSNKSNLLDDIEYAKNKYIEVSQKELKEEKGLLKQEHENDVEIIKTYLDSLKNLLHFISPLHLDFKSDDSKEQSALEIDSHFYETFNELYFKLKEIIPLYNQVRNYVTQKPFSSKKFKLNFENSTLLDGWDKNKERDNFSVLFRKTNDFGFYEYFLGIMSKGNNKIFSNILESSQEENYFEKMEYKLLPGPDKMLPKVFFSKSNIEYYSPSEEILDIRNHSSHTKGGKPQEGFSKKEFNLKDCHKMIDFYKESLEKHPEWSIFNFKFKETSKYQDTSDFYKDVADQGYKIDFKNISDEIINQLVDEGKLYLFQIYNKDFSSYSKGRKNLHTMYWEELFSEENLKDIVYKLNGEAEIFYRKQSIKAKPTHPKNQDVKNKDPINGKKYSNFKYDLIKDKRYTEDKFLFHCPIAMNFKAKGSIYDINRIVNKTIKENSQDINILSIDRGERHLAYWTLLNSKGEIIEQDSFNIIKEETIGRETNYHKKLDEKEGSRDEARKNWKKIENIKELKEGYLSQVVHKLAKLAVEKNAIIVFEDLNYGFKRGRFKIEKQVYQKFEKMLIEKFNYLMFKDRQKEELAGSLNALQLTPQISSEKQKGKQTGIIFYVDPNYTSKIDPKTGFINLLFTKYESVEKSQSFFNKFESIKYNGEYFEFTFDYSNFRDKFGIKQKEWTICSFGKRVVTQRSSDNNNHFKSETIFPTEKLENLFEKFGIEYDNRKNIKEDIVKEDSKDFHKSLLFYLSKILQLRNSIPNTEEDFILSCVKDKYGTFFDSSNAKKTEPTNADSNGAYNIGVKGLMLIDRIRNTEEDKKVDLKISRDEFVNYVIERNS